MEIEEKLKNHILLEYRSLRDYAVKNKIPYTTIVTLFKNGLNKAKMPTIIKIAESLELDINSLVAGKVIKSSEKVSTPDVFMQKYNRLNSIGKARVDSYIDGLLNSASYSKNTGE